MTKQYWLLKSEPNEFSVDDLQKMPKKIEHWDGVRNYQARNIMRDEMKKGDLAFFYHSNANPPSIVGIVEVVKEGYPDHTAFDKNDKHFDPKSKRDSPTWFMVDVKFKKKFKSPVSLDELKSNHNLKEMKLTQKGQRLSVQRVTASEWEEVLRMVE